MNKRLSLDYKSVNHLLTKIERKCYLLYLPGTGDTAAYTLVTFFPWFGSCNPADPGVLPLGVAFGVAFGVKSRNWAGLWDGVPDVAGLLHLEPHVGA